MDFRILEFVVVLTFVERIGSLPLPCPYNGTSYREGETVRTDEPCLSCVCRSGALECSLRVCAEHPNVLHPGCFLLHKPNQCCPQIFCDENFSPTGIELRTANFKQQTSNNKLHKNDCVISGSIYAEGSAVASLQPCEYCYCAEGEIKCVKPRCFHLFEGCRTVYETSSCCPTQYDCRDSNISFLTTQMKNFVSANINVTVLNDFLSSHVNLDLELGKEENIETDLIKTENELREESTVAKNEERNKEETTIEPVQESTVPVTENHATTLGFQAMKTESFDGEPVTASFSEESTLEVEVNRKASPSVKDDIKDVSGVQIRSSPESFEGIETSMESHDGCRDNASQEIDDYDSYDYNEHQLPPSLPNLVIFPFVAADAVVKIESIKKLNKDEVEKIDTRHVFYRNYFSPPTKSEGGFIPKKPAMSEEPFNEHSFLSKERSKIESHKYNMREENAVVLSSANDFSQRPNEMNYSVLADNKQTNGTSANNFDNVLNMTLKSSFEDIIHLDSETTPGFLMQEEATTFDENRHNKKPVTVTFKNFVVDFYPNYLITTSNGVHWKNETQIAAEEDFRHTAEKSQEEIYSLDRARDPPSTFSDTAYSSASPEGKREISTTASVNPPPSVSFFSDELIHSLTSEATPTTTTTTTPTSKKQKFSSKIKGQIITTVKPKREKISQKVESDVGTVNSSTESYSELSEGFAVSLSAIDKKKNYNEKRKPVRTEEITPFYETFRPVETKNEKTELPEYLRGGTPLSLSRKPDVTATVGGNNRMTPNAGVLLKLAGCNIYGMMYRVGKVITELSGPCLECSCTDLGVQCRALKC